jgi:threonine/homoserine/homoserine lactone efflux protein
VFWITVGAPILAAQGPGGSALFLAAFYLVLIGSKVAVAGVLQAGRERLLRGRGYAIVLRASAVLLLATGVLLAVEGVQTLT